MFLENGKVECVAIDMSRLPCMVGVGVVGMVGVGGCGPDEVRMCGMKLA